MIDINLRGEEDNYDGKLLIDWLNRKYKDIPYIVVTGMVGDVYDLKMEYPGIDVLVKGQSNIEDYADAMGFSNRESTKFVVVPRD